MRTGVVKWFNNAKGYGFILSDEDSKDVFAHYSAIEMDGYKTLRAGQCVAFDSIDGPKGLHAVNIKMLEAAPSLNADAVSDHEITADNLQNTPEEANQMG